MGADAGLELGERTADVGVVSSRVAFKRRDGRTLVAAARVRVLLDGRARTGDPARARWPARPDGGSVEREMTFRDRQDAGRQLAERVASLSLRAPAVVALPRGGVIVAAEIARRLRAPLGVLPVRKVGAPAQPEYAIGAVASGGVRVYDHEAIRGVGVSPAELAVRTREAELELARRERRYRRGAPLAVRGRDVVLVDDGVATGLTIRAALRSIASSSPHRVVLAVPVAAASVARALRQLVDELVCLEAPGDLLAVGAHYEDFPQVSDDEVLAALDASRATPVA